MVDYDFALEQVGVQMLIGSKEYLPMNVFGLWV